MCNGKGTQEKEKYKVVFSLQEKDQISFLRRVRVYESIEANRRPEVVQLRSPDVRAKQITSGARCRYTKSVKYVKKFFFK